MELIYTDKERVDVGIIDCIQLDYDCAGEKDFELTVEVGGLEIERGSMWYIIGTEYMGFIESIKTDSDENNVVYKGTNTRGILAKRIVEADAEVRAFSGNAAEIINALLVENDAQDMFICDATALEIGNAQVVANTDLYEAIISILKTENSIPIFTVQTDRKVHITADLFENLSDELQYNGKNTYSFEIEDDGNAYNHFICISKTETGNQFKIHLFTDQNGGVQPYAHIAIPLQDSDYILDERNKLITGIDERELLIESDTSLVHNYIVLNAQPRDWAINYTSYYENNDSEYKSVEPITTESYALLTNKPSDWSTGYGNYYTKTSTGYSSVSAETVNVYKVLSKKPSDWEKNYGIYYERTSDGTTYIYSGVKGTEYNSYKKQTIKPSDWASNYGNYYQIKNKKYVKVTGVVYYEKKGKKKTKKTRAPSWKKNKYYTQYKKEKAPAYKQGKYFYIYSQNTQVPVWQKTLYYTRVELNAAPAFRQGIYYCQVNDHYAAMVENALTKIKELSPSQKASMNITDYECRIGDVVGCHDSASGIEICEEVTNIIFKITDGLESYEYTIGGN